MPNLFALIRRHCWLTMLGALLAISLAVPAELPAATKKKQIRPIE